MLFVCVSSGCVLKFSKENTRTVREICLKLTEKTSGGHDWSCTKFFIVNFEQILHNIDDWWAGS